MKRIAVSLFVLFTCLVTAGFAISGEHGGGHGGSGKSMVTVEDPAKCSICGMDRRMFAYSRALVTFEDGSVTGTCSVSCAREAVDKHAGKKVKMVQVADYDSKQLTDAKKAVWVIGGSKQGVMTSVAKWAFGEKGGAEKFVAKFGGRISGYDEVWKKAAE